MKPGPSAVACTRARANETERAYARPNKAERAYARQNKAERAYARPNQAERKLSTWIHWIGHLCASLQGELVMRQDPERRPLREHEWKKGGIHYGMLPPQF
jgi:hypothetical protein